MERHRPKTRIGKSKPPPDQQQHHQAPPERSSVRTSKAKRATIAQGPATDAVRLHISPLTPESAEAILPAKYLSTTSFHAIDTFPEKSYGFATVSRAEASVLQRKYHGTVFRGVKMSVEEARPARKSTASADSRENCDTKKKSPTQGSPERENGVLRGYQIPEGRQVKRGWTKDTQKGGKGHSTSECLFKTILPPVVASDMKGSQLNDDKSSKKTNRKTAKNLVVVKEFRNSTKFPAFLKISALPTDSSERSAEFIEGLGWVNDAGNVLDGAPAKRLKLSVDESKSGADGVGEVQPGGKVGSNILPVDDQEMQDASANNINPSADSTSDTNKSEQDSDSSSDGESIYSRMSSSESAVEEISDSESSRGSSSESSASDSSGNTSTDDSETGSESEETEEEGEEEEEEEEEESTPEQPASNVPATQQSSNFANLTNIFKPTLSLDTQSSGQFKFFGDGLEHGSAEDDLQTDDQTAAADDSFLFTPITPRVARCRSGAPTPDTAVAPRFRDLLPFAQHTPTIQRDYFPTLTADSQDTQDIKSSCPGIGLAFPHAYDNSLHDASIWKSVKLPKILTTGEITGKETSLENTRDKGKGIGDGDTEMSEAIQPAKEALAAQEPTFGKKQKETVILTSTDKPKTGAGSSIVTWAGKKKTFDDDGEKDIEMLDASAPTPVKAKTGVGSGVTAWAGKKKTFDDDEEEWEEDGGPQIEDATPVKPKPALKKRAQPTSGVELEQTSSVVRVWEKVFHENRGEWNRQWKRKKREAGKAKRRREKARRGWAAVSA